jgi:hypothetical protein
MKDGAVDLVAEWLGDDVTGVNALLPVVPRPDTDPAPSAVTILTELTHSWVARGEILRGNISGPLLLVHNYADTQAEVLPELAVNRAPVEIAIRYAARGSDTKVVTRDGWRVLRAAHRTISLKIENAQTQFERFGVRYSVPSGIRYVNMYAASGQDLVVGALVLTLPALDPWALGITP